MCFQPMYTVDVPLMSVGGSTSIAEGDLSLVGRSFMGYPWPPRREDCFNTRCNRVHKEHIPIAFAEPGSTNDVVTPPAMLSL